MPADCPECGQRVAATEIRQDPIEGGSDSPHIIQYVPGPPYVALSPCGHHVYDRAFIEVVRDA